MDGRIAALMETIKREAVLAAWPVGSIYTSTEATSPATLFGGTWEQIKDRFLLAAGDDYAAGSTGGKSGYELRANIGMVDNATSSIGYAGATRTVYQQSTTSLSLARKYTITSGSSSVSTFNNSTVVTEQSSSSATTTIMPPYVAVYMWKRTA